MTNYLSSMSSVNTQWVPETGMEEVQLRKAESARLHVKYKTRRESQVGMDSSGHEARKVRRAGVWI